MRVIPEHWTAVIRREFDLLEGDAFNVSKLRRARRSIRNLGFFSKAKVDSMAGSAKDKTIIRVSVEEKSTGEISWGRVLIPRWAASKYRY